jgi:hypothetical protein
MPTNLVVSAAEEVLLEVGAELEVLHHGPRQLPQLLPDRVLPGLVRRTERAGGSAIITTERRRKKEEEEKEEEKEVKVMWSTS